MKTTQRQIVINIHREERNRIDMEVDDVKDYQKFKTSKGILVA